MQELHSIHSFPRRMLSALLSAVGGLFTLLLLCRMAESTLAGWSPTETARQCFPYPTLSALPDREDAVQSLLSASFFGSDALLFDAGEENTGTSDPPAPSHSDGSALPQTPLTEPWERPPAVTDIYDYDESARVPGEPALLPYDLTGGAAPGEVLLSNTTAYSIDIPAALDAPYPMDDAITDEPLVLILHTHGTEAFAPEGAASVPASALMRSSDPAENIVAVGGVMADILNRAGIPAIHCEIMHDLTSYQRSYSYAADTIQKYLAEYPSIKYVFDVHRDAILRSTGDYVRPITQIDGKLSAQIMLLVGTDEKGADHPDWMDNFTVAARLQSRLTEKYDRFARPINIRGASFNEQFTSGSLLIEIGSAGNTLSEAKEAARWLTYEIAAMIRENHAP